MQFLRTHEGKRNSRLGQQVVEYALVLAALSMALTMMYIYAKRGLQARIKDAVDHEIGCQADSEQVLAAEQYQQTNSVTAALTKDTTEINKDVGQAGYYFNSETTATSITNTLDNELNI